MELVVVFDHKLILIREVRLGQTLPGEDVLIVVLEYKFIFIKK